MMKNIFISLSLTMAALPLAAQVGIGTTTPVTDLHILSGTAASSLQYSYIKGITITGNGSAGYGGPGFYLENKDNPAGKRLFKINFTSNGTSEGFMNFQAVSDDGGSNVTANIMSITHGGNVGIGSSTFSSSTPEKLLVDASYTASPHLISGRGIASGPLQINIRNQSSGTNSSSNFVAMANNGDLTQNNINMGINSNYNSAATIIGGANTAYVVASGSHFAIGNATSGKDLIFFTGGTATSQERARVSADGFVPGADNLYSLGRSGARWKEVWSANGVIQTSDARLKTSIEEIPYGLNEVLQLQPVVYDWIGEPGRRKVGLLAQDVASIVPEVVSGDPETQTLGMNYGELVPVLINAIKELQQEVESLKQEANRRSSRRGKNR
jgi:hypothetical protein